MRKDFEEWVKADMEETLREDYEVGLFVKNLGKIPKVPDIFSVQYKAHCEKCGFTLKYDYKVPVKI
jgi:hypothetical protein